MTWQFLLGAAVMTAAALAILLPPLLRRRDDGRRPVPALLLAAALPLAGALLYAALGTPAGMNPQPEAGAESMDQAVAQLEARLRQQPDNLEGWMLLGRSRMAMQDPAGAVDAYRQARQLAPQNAVVLVALAEAIAQQNENRLTGEPAALLTEALRHDATNQRALWFAGIAAWQSEQYGEAARHWESLLELLEPGSDVAASVREQLAAARQQAGMAPPEAAPPAATASEGATLHVGVRVSSRLADRYDDSDTVFVFARPAEGPGMPLAVKRFPAAQLPAELTLGPGDAMTAQHALAPGMRVVVTARITSSGSATPQAGDLQTESAVFEVGTQTDLALTIDRVLGEE